MYATSVTTLQKATPYPPPPPRAPHPRTRYAHGGSRFPRLEAVAPENQPASEARKLNPLETIIKVYTETSGSTDARPDRRYPFFTGLPLKPYFDRSVLRWSYSVNNRTDRFTAVDKSWEVRGRPRLSARSRRARTIQSTLSSACTVPPWVSLVPHAALRTTCVDWAGGVLSRAVSWLAQPS